MIKLPRLGTVVALMLLAAQAGRSDELPPIQDNSFLIEEAYNQERGVVQHVLTLARAGSGGWMATFSQEWPLRGQRHQLSFSLPVEVHSALGRGLGDIALNYRLQLVGSGESRLAVAPRLSLLVPTGDARARRGAGGLGLQLNLPVSARLAKRLVAHWNAGVTQTPRAQGISGGRSAISTFNLGQGLALQAGRRLDMLCEVLFLRGEEIVGERAIRWSSELLVNPGVRWAHDLPGGLQIVPGVSVPIGVGPSRGEVGVFVYLSVEHPFKR